MVQENKESALASDLTHQQLWNERTARRLEQIDKKLNENNICYRLLI